MKTKGFIDGKWVDSKSGETIPVHSMFICYSNYHLFWLTAVDPADDKLLGTVPEMGLEETKEAIETAGKAFKTWSKTTAKVSDSVL